MEIKMSWLVKLQRATIRLFEAEDCEWEYVDRNAVTGLNRSINHWLGKMTDDKEMQQKIYDIIINNNFNTDDMTFKPICDALRGLGFTIREGE